MLRKEAVTSDLLNLVKDLQNIDVLNNFVLTGGTALALQLGHRKSIDIDLFSSEIKDYNFIHNLLIDKYPNLELFHKNDSMLMLKINSINVDFVSVKGKVLEKPLTEDGIKYFGLNDISAMKLLAIQNRKEPKDYIDIMFIKKIIGMEKMFENYQEKYEMKDLINVKKAITDVKEINPFKLNNIQMLDNNFNLLDIYNINNYGIKEHNGSIDVGKRENFLKKLFKRK